ncbi:hypothetical protein DPX16_7393 [Anabarilius grahami]|uniref:Uncharacterized protein n=1 Tax=Anabarilius grahami TaxID=495550 RepID=A0A3N0Z2A0_ANAGA|nr:hypothetical protein DPX16_7393 [Anabarilius grahami]
MRIVSNSVQPYIVQTGQTFRMKLNVSEWLVDKSHAEYRCVYIVRVMATRAPVAQNKPHVDHAAVTWVCFSHESRTEAVIKVVYCNGQGNTLLIAAPAQNNTEPPLTSIRPVPPAVCGSAGLGSWKDACFLASVGFVRCHQYGRAKKFCSV